MISWKGKAQTIEKEGDMNLANPRVKLTSQEFEEIAMNIRNKL